MPIRRNKSQKTFEGKIAINQENVRGLSRLLRRVPNSLHTDVGEDGKVYVTSYTALTVAHVRFLPVDEH